MPKQPPRAGCDRDLARSGNALQPCCQVRRLADRNVLPEIAGPGLLADHDEAGCDPDARPRCRAGRCVHNANRVDDCEAGAYGMFSIVLARHGITEIDQDTVALVLGDEAMELRCDPSRDLMKGDDLVVDILRVALRGQRHRADQLTGHDRQLALLAAARAKRFRGRSIVIAFRDGCGFGLPHPNAIQGLVRTRRTGRSGVAEVRDERLGDRIGLRVQLALEQRDEILIALERLGLASIGGERLDDQPMRILAQGIHGNGPVGRPERGFRMSGLQRVLAVPDHGIDGQAVQPLPFPVAPFRPCVFFYIQIRQQRIAVEIGGRGQRRAAALDDQGLEADRIAIDHPGREPDVIVVAANGVLPENPP
ncbi:hypothetical protein GGD67_002147 [Bradyrhizobium sp. IAR9]|nr:hypothetical protein [Bradyrhizobium sp. IAR9]